MQESARTAFAWLRANARRYGLGPAFHRDTDVHLAHALRRTAETTERRPASGWSPRWCPRARESGLRRPRHDERDPPGAGSAHVDRGPVRDPACIALSQ